MRSFVGTRVITLHDGVERIGMVSSVRGTDIIITLSPSENIIAPLDDAEISKTTPEETAQGIEFLIEW